MSEEQLTWKRVHAIQKLMDELQIDVLLEKDIFRILSSEKRIPRAFLPYIACDNTREVHCFLVGLKEGMSIVMYDLECKNARHTKESQAGQGEEKTDDQ